MRFFPTTGNKVKWLIDKYFTQIIIGLFILQTALIIGVTVYFL